jgi:hypothetical protein
MTPGLRVHRQASLRVAVAEGLPEDMREQTREILSVQSTNPRKGHATALMHTVCAEADRHWITLLVNVHAFDDGMSDEQLMRWYGKFGFSKIQDEPCVLMARAPEPPRIARVN